MSRDLLDPLLAMARRRQAAIAVALLLPWLLPALALAWRTQGASWMLPLAMAVVALAAAWRAPRLLDPHWVVRRLDARYPGLEDSTALLLDAPTALPALSRWQRERIAQRLQELRPRPDLRAPWPRRALVASALAALLLATLALFWPAPAPSAPDRAIPPTAAVAAEPSIRLTAQAIFVQAPAYTGVPARTEPGLRARVHEGARLRWTLRYSGAPERVELVFHDGQRLPLALRDGAWSGARTLARSTLYRIEVAGEGAPTERRLHRIDVIPDRAPTIRVQAPDRSLSVMEPGQKQWAVAFEASDDHGLGAAQMRITLAQGSGENITVSARTLSLSGTGDARRRTYRRSLDLAGLGFAAGDDLVVRLSVSDRRTPGAQTTRSASFILRWPPETGAEATGVEGLVKRTLPAYFRSQRQIIIDSEALLAQRSKLKPDQFLERSDGIGVDQRILRLRYGQFLGEEAVSTPSAAATGGGEAEAGHEPEQHADAGTGQANAHATSMLESYGHTHDESEAATLLDKDTRALLKAALDEMWQSELHLRQGDPRKALPYQNRALRLIKQVQQASRIYLARVGLELPPIDEARRMGGDRAGIQPASAAVPRASTQASPALDLWQQLGGADAAATRAAADRFEAWLRANEAQVADGLDLFAALDAWREPGCRDCARRLRARLWPLLPTTLPGISPRREADARGRAYLDALRAGASP